MKASLRYATFLLALFGANADQQEPRVLRQAGGSVPGGRLQNMIDTTCSTYDCEAVDIDGLDCTFEKPERPDLTGLSEDEIAQLKSDFQAEKEERREKMLKCACCGDMSVEDILAAKGDGDGNGGRPGLSSGGGSGAGRPGGMGGGNRPEGEGGGGAFTQEMLDEKCEEFDCSTVEAESVDCTRFDDSMNTNTRGRRRKNRLYCGCCRD